MATRTSSRSSISRSAHESPFLHVSQLLLVLLLRVLVVHANTSNSSNAVVYSTASAEVTATSSSLSSIVPLHLQADFVPRIHLRAAVLHSSPFAIVEEQEDGSLTARGLQMDLLEKLKAFALQDQMELTVELTPFQYSSNMTYSKALDFIASDCDDDVYVNSTHNCSSFDLIIADYFSTPERLVRVDFSPPWLTNAISAMKYVPLESDEKDHDQDHASTTNATYTSTSTSKTKGDTTTKHHDSETTTGRREDITTLTEASQDAHTVCVLKGTHSSKVVIDKFQEPMYLQCHTDQQCLEHLKYGRCALFARDELVLRNIEFHNHEYVVTRERFNTQYVVWPMPYHLPPLVSYLLKRWIVKAIQNTTMDSLYYKYFERELCPIGTAGEDCQLPCHPEHGQSDMHGKCICDSTKWTGEDCSIEVQEDLNMIPTSLKGLAYALFGINVMVLVVCAVWLISYWNSDQVQASQPFFLLLVLLGCLVSSSTILALAQEDHNEGEGHDLCMFIPWLYSVGFSITFGTLFAKIRRVYVLFTTQATAAVAVAHPTPPSASSVMGFAVPSTTHTSHNHSTANPTPHHNHHHNTLAQSFASSTGIVLPKPMTMRGSASDRSSFTEHLGPHGQRRQRYMKISFQETIAVLFVVTMIDVIPLIVWSLTDPLAWERVVIQADQFDVPLASVGHCVCDSWIIFASLIGTLHLSLLATACVLCYKARKIPTMFQEGKFVSLAIMSNLQILIVGVPILVIVGSDTVASFAVRAAIIWMNDLAVILLVFGNLMYSFHMRPTKSKDVRESINKAIHVYSCSLSGAAKQGSPALSPLSNKCPRSGDGKGGDEEFYSETEEDAEAPPMVKASSPTKVEQPPRQQKRKDMISSLSLGSGNSETEENEEAVLPDSEKSPFARNECMSSLTLGSSTGNGHKRSGNRSVTFGMTYYSEGNDDGSERAVPIEPLEVQEARETTTSEGPNPRMRSRSHDSQARFTCDSSNHKAPPRPPRRPGSCADIIDVISSTDTGGTDSELTSPPPSPSSPISEAESPGDSTPRMPDRICSTVEALDPDNDIDNHAQAQPPRLPDRIVSIAELSTTSEEDKAFDKKNANYSQRPPQQPVRVPSHADVLLDDDDSSTSSDRSIAV